MNISSGWIKLHRLILDWPLWHDPKTSHLFLYCLLRANPSPRLVNGFSVPRGSFITSLTTLAADTGLSVQNVRTALAKLAAAGTLNICSNNRFSLVTVCRYDRYQHPDDLRQHAQPAFSNTPSNTLDVAATASSSDYCCGSAVGRGTPPRSPAPLSPTVNNNSLNKNFSFLSSGAWANTNKKDFSDQVVDYWNRRTLGVFPQASPSAPQPRRHRCVALRASRYGPDALPLAIDRALTSHFLQKVPWFDFDWLFASDANFANVLHGKYDNISQSPSCHEHTRQSSKPQTIADPDSFVERF